MTEETNKNTINNNEEQAQTEQGQTQQAQTEQSQAEQSQTQQSPHSYAVRPEHRHHRRIAYSDQNEMLPLRNKLNIGFMLLAIAGVILWTQLEGSRTPAVIVLIIAVVLKIAEVCIRLFKK